MNPIRPRRAEQNGLAKLTFAKAEKIRAAYQRGTSQPVLAQRYGVSSRTISAICTRRRYAAPPEPEPGYKRNLRRGHR